MSRLSPELINEIVRAGAGAGKTTALTKKVLDVARLFLTNEKRPPKIVVTTFTRKATEELRERLVREACESGDERLIDFVTSKSNLHISTIHGVLSLFLRRLGHWLDIDSGFSVLDAQAADRVARNVLREILVQEVSLADLMEDFTFSQLCRMVRDYAAVNYKNKLEPFSARDLKNLRQLECERMAVQLESLAQRLLIEAQNEKWSEYATHLISCAKLLASAQVGLYVERLEKLSKPRYASKSPPIPETLHDALKELLKECEKFESESFNDKNDAVYAEKAAVFDRLASKFSQMFFEKKISSGQIEIDDLENITLLAINKHPEVARAFSADWDYWLIDEFQDTSPKQVDLLKALTGEKPVFIVGDPQQSIYLFRGARSSVFSEKENEILATDGKKSELIKNYRSTPGLLLFFNDFFSTLSDAFIKMEPKSDNVLADEIVASFCTVNKSIVPIEPLAPLALKVLTGVKQGLGFDEFCVLSRTNRELQVVAQYFESLNIPTHLHASDGFYGRREILDILSLLKFLLNSHDNKNLIRLLRSPWFRIEDQTLVNALGARPAPIFYWAHLQKNLSEHTTIQRLEKIMQMLPAHGVFETLRRAVIEAGLIEASHLHDSTGRRESNIWKFFALLREKERAPGFSYLSFVQNAFRGVETSDGEKESDAVAALEPNRVNLMTIHKAKGLKFKHVLLPNIGRRLSLSETRKHEQPFVFSEAEQKFTLALRLGEERKLTHNLAGQKYFSDMAEVEREEYLRVLYVAMTRAEKSVTLHWQEPFDKSSWAALIKIKLEPGVHKHRDYSYEVLREFVEPTPYTPKIKDNQEPRKIWSTLTLPSQNENKKRISVTQLVEGNVSKDNVSKDNVSKDNASLVAASAAALQQSIEAPVIGQRIHSYFENIKYTHSDSKLYSEQHLKAYCDKWFSKRGAEFERAVKYVLNLNEPPIEKLIRGGEVEWGFQLQTAAGIIEGQIDLWGTVNGKTWIVDYKSGSSKHQDKAFAQLDIYSSAIRARGVKTPIYLAVVYAMEQIIEIRETRLS